MPEINEVAQVFRYPIEVGGVKYGKVGFTRHDGKDWIRLVCWGDAECAGTIEFPLEAAAALVSLMQHALATRERPDEVSTFSFAMPDA